MNNAQEWAQTDLSTGLAGAEDYNTEPVDTGLIDSATRLMNLEAAKNKKLDILSDTQKFNDIFGQSTYNPNAVTAHTDGPQKQQDNLSDTTTLMPDGTLESNANKIWNDLSHEELQAKIGDTIGNYALQSDPTTGQQYYYQPDENGNQTRVDYNGKARRFYSYNTKDNSNDEVKFGLSTDKYSTADARYNPLTGWEPGPKGVDTSKNVVDVLLPFDKATELEALIHGNKNALEQRVVKGNDLAGRKQYGSGASEYYNSIDSVLGDVSQSDLTNVVPKDFIEANSARLEPTVTGDNFISTTRATNIAKAPVAMASKWLADTAAGLTSLVSDDAAKAVFGTSDERSAKINKLLGYDNRYSSEHMQVITSMVAANMGQEIAEKDKGWVDHAIENYKGFGSTQLQAMNRLVSNLDGEEFGRIITESLKSPETAVEFYGVIALETLGAKGAGLVTKAGKANKLIEAVNAETKLSAADKLAKIDKIKEVSGIGNVDRLVLTAAEQSPLALLSFGQTKVQEEEFKKNTGRGYTADEALGVTMMNILSFKLEKAVDMHQLKGMENVVEKVDGILSKLPKNVAGNVAASLLRNSGRLVAGAVEESQQELVQGYMEELNKYNLAGADAKPMTKAQQLDMANKAATGMLAAIGSTGIMQSPAIMRDLTRDTAVMDKIKAIKTKPSVDSSIKEGVTTALPEYADDSARLMGVAKGLGDIETLDNVTEEDRGDDYTERRLTAGIDLLFAHDAMSPEAKAQISPEYKTKINDIRAEVNDKAVQSILEDIRTGKASVTSKKLAVLDEAGKQAVIDEVVKFGSHDNISIDEINEAFSMASNTNANYTDQKVSHKSNNGLDLDLGEASGPTVKSSVDTGNSFSPATNKEIGLVVADAPKDVQESVKAQVLTDLGVSDKKQKFYKKSAEAKKIFSEYTNKFLVKNGKRNLTKTEFDLLYSTNKGMVPKAAEALAYKDIIDNEDSTPAEVEAATVSYNERIAKLQKLAANQKDKATALETTLKSLEPIVKRKFKEYKEDADTSFDEDKVKELFRTTLNTKDSKLAANVGTWEFLVSQADVFDHMTTGTSRAHTMLAQIKTESDVIDQLLNGIDKGLLDNTIIEDTLKANKKAFNNMDKIALVKKLKDLQKIIAKNEEETVDVNKSLFVAKEALQQAETDLNNAGNSVKKVYNTQKELLRQHKRLVTELQYRNNKIKEVQHEISKKTELLKELEKKEPSKNALAIAMAAIEKAVKKAINLLMSNTYDISSYKEDLRTKIEALNNELVSLERGVAPVVSVEGVHTKQPSAMSVKELTKTSDKLESKINTLDSKLAKVGEQVTPTGKLSKAAANIASVLTQTGKIKTLEAEKAKLEESAREYRKKRAELLKSTVGSKSAVAVELKKALGTGLAAVSTDSTGKKEKVAIDPNAVLEVSENPGSLLASMTLDELSDDTIKEYKDKAIVLLDKLIDTKGLIKSDGTLINSSKVGDSPAIALLRTKDGKWNENLVTALMLAMEKSMSINLNSWKINTDIDIANMLGLPNKSVVTQDMRSVFQNAGKFKSTVAGEIGDSMLELAGLSIKKNADSELAERLSQDLGHIGLLMAMEDKYLQKMDTTFITTHSYLLATDENYADNVKAETISSDDIKANMTKKIGMVKAVATTTAEKTAAHRAKIKDILDSIGQDNTLAKGPSFKELDPRLAKKLPKGNNITYVPDQSHNVMMRSWSEEHTINTQAIDTLMTLVPDDVEANKKLVLGYMGYKSVEDMANLSSDSYDSSVASNSELESEYDELANIHNMIKAGTISPQVWFEWFFTRSGRFTLDSNGLNPQNNKQLDRWLVTPKEHTQYVNLKDKITLEAWQFAIAQAFGFGIDKMSPDNVKRVGELISELKADDLLKAVQDNKLSSIVLSNGAKLGSDHIGHTLQAISAMKDKEAAKGKGFTTTLSAEYDGITNGFINKTMQIPVVNKDEVFDDSTVKETLDAGGVHVNSTEEGNKAALSQAEQFEKGAILDVYKKLGGAVNTTLKAVVGVLSELGKAKVLKEDSIKKTTTIYTAFQGLVPAKTVEGTVTSALRNLFKPTVMTFGYASSINSIKKALGYNIANSALDAVVKALNTGKSDVATDSAIKYLLANIATRKYVERADDGKGKEVKIVKLDNASLKALLHNTSADLIKLNDGTVLLTAIQQTMSTAIGSQVESIMTKKYGEMVKANNTINASFKVMFRLYKQRFTEQLEELTAKVKEHNDKITDEADRIYISKSDILDITRGLKEIFPMIKAPLSFDLDSSILIHDNRRITVEDGRFTTARVHVNKDVFSDGSLSTSITNMLKELDEAQSAGAVIPLHFIDGSEMGLTQQEVAGILGIHDAIAVGLNAAVTGPKQYNQNFYYINKKFSMVRELMNSFARTAFGGNNREFSTDELKAMEPIIRFEDKKNVEYGFYDIAKELLNLDQKVEEGRKELFSHTMTVQQMVGMTGTKVVIAGDNTFEDTPRTADVVKLAEVLKDYKGTPTVKGNKKTNGVKANGKKVTPEFDKLQSYVQGQHNMTYAGVGSRETPPEILAKMTEVSQKLAGKGYSLQSGGTIGADMAFEGKGYYKVLTAGNADVKNNKGKVVLKANAVAKIGTKAYTDAYYVFVSKDNNGRIKGSEFVKPSAIKGYKSYSAFNIKDSATDKIALKVAEEMHPNFSNLKTDFTKKLMARNTYQVFGSNLDKPVDFVLFYAKEAAGSLRPEGGTGQAVEMARIKGIPTINMMDSNWEKQLNKIINKDPDGGGKDITEGKNEASAVDSIYNKLGDKTESGNVQIKKVYQQEGVAYAKSIGGVFSLRITKSNTHFGNPFSSVDTEVAKGLIRTKNTKESVEKYIEWVLSDSTEIEPQRHAWIRRQLQSGALKGKPIVYYKELGEPSHATALDYLINKYDWSVKPSDTKVDTASNSAIKLGTVVTHNGNHYITRGYTKSGALRLVNVDGKNMPVNPMPTNVVVTGQLPVTVYKDVEYVYSSKTGKLFNSSGEAWKGVSNSTKETIIEQITKGTKTVNIDSNQVGLEYALTNPTHTSSNGVDWVKGDKPTRDMLAKGIDYDGKHYADVEQAYQALKDNNENDTKPSKDESGNYKLMVALIATKLQTFPRLVKGIDDKGGLEYLNKIVHQPTKANSVWETGGQDWFKSALIEAYNNVIKESPVKGSTSKAETKVEKGILQEDSKERIFTDLQALLGNAGKKELKRLATMMKDC